MTEQDNSIMKKETHFVWIDQFLRWQKEEIQTDNKSKRY